MKRQTKQSPESRIAELEKELEIEASLERVRAKTMAMHDSGDIDEVVIVLFDELLKLGTEKTIRCGINILNDGRKSEVWSASFLVNGEATLTKGFIDMASHPLLSAVYKAWQNKELHSLYELTGTNLKKYYQVLIASPDYPFKHKISELPKKQYNNAFFYPDGCLFAFTAEPLSIEVSRLFTRFAAVFGLTYRRFLDLQKAEAQAREARIEAGLERVRAKAMAMRSSEDLAETIGVFYHELGLLSVTPRRCGLGLVDKETHITEISTMNTTEQGESIEVIGKLKMVGHPVLEGIYDNWLLQKEYHPVLRGNEIKEYYQFVRPQISYPDYPNDVVQYGYFFFFRDGGAFTWTDMELPEDELQIYRRFNSVLSLTYRRYKDIKEAEAQARESQIQLGLERVRAKAMAMQTSEELNELIGTVFSELTKLDFVLTRCLIMIFDPKTNSSRWWMANSEAPSEPMNYLVQYHKHPAYAAYLKAWKVRDLKWRYALKGKVKRDWDNFLFVDTELSLLPDFVIAGMKAPEQVLLSASFNNFGCLTLVSLEPLSDEHADIMLRFAKVFDMSYTRFNDLKQAEAQTREATIQLALERIRARTMAMQKSDELAETAMTLFQQFNELGVKPERIFIGNMDENARTIEFWGTDQGGKQMNPRFEVNADATIGFSQIYKAWKTKKKTHTIIMKGKELADNVRYVQDVLHMPMQPELVQRQRIMYSAFFSKGLLMIVTPEIQSNETIGVLERFAGVFDGTYTRFLDLQQSEAQTREAKIEAGLERVRAKAMAMHDSNDVGNATALVFSELYRLGITTIRCGVVIIEESTKLMEVWSATSPEEGKIDQGSGKLDMTGHPLWRNLFDTWKQRKPILTYELAGHDLLNYYKAISTAPGYKAPELDPSYTISDDINKARQYCSCFLFAEGGLFAFTGEPFPPAESKVLEKFTAVFSLTYRRYLDLKQAEEQAREAKIEAALEKVRSKAMAMHDSNDLSTAVSLVFTELKKLGIRPIRCGVGLFMKDAPRSLLYTATISNDSDTLDLVGWVEMVGHPVLEKIYDSWVKQEDYFPVLNGMELKAYYKKLSHGLLIPSIPDGTSDEKQYGHFLPYPEGMLNAWAERPYSEPELKILDRFKSIISLTFRRYHDLKKAEEAAREAQIEASLERVRGKAMAMRNSGDLSAAASTVFTELRNLGINPIRSGVGLLSKDTHKAKLYSNTSSSAAGHLSLMGEIDLSRHPVFEQQYQSWLTQENYFVALGGKELAAYYKILSAGLNADLNISVKKDGEEYGYWFMFSEGFLYAWSDKGYTDAEIKILERFKNVIELTFRRYIELQKSEAQARDAVRQASLDRVRAEIASMRTVGDLDRITPLIWNELTILGVPFIRCGVFIMDETQEVIHTYLSTPDGKAIAAFQLHFDNDTGNGVNGAALRGWREKQMVTLHWTEEEFRNFSHSLVEQGEIVSEEGYLTERPPTGLDLHFFPFLQGMLYAGNTEPLNDDDKDLVQSLADAFSTAYARYEDFNRLELAKQEVELTLNDLKTAQTRLIQSEKMASLGELTAGIAHEIQNPLNFVNNFSEVNQEMIDELEEELNAGNIEEALAIAADIKQNEQKISHHGKRADGIVKGMLQHSRTGGGEKLPTNINSVAEEYMRLSYHGLRAKDKVFNAEMVMNFDPNLPRVEAVEQDIGRVFLNLFNNAFYAVNQKKKDGGATYNPEVTVTTSTEDGQVTIKVKDNGVGMPDHVKEKIMQPFFTTKPTGEGTGLGLSLTYDMVVKGHGGTIAVTSKEGEGSEFTISLPHKLRK